MILRAIVDDDVPWFGFESVGSGDYLFGGLLFWLGRGYSTFKLLQSSLKVIGLTLRLTLDLYDILWLYTFTFYLVIDRP
jgi:hypothetical protein